MLTREGCLARQARLWNAVDEDVEWLLIADPRHVHYLSNFWIQPLSFSCGERGILLLERDEGASLLVDNFALRSAAGEPFVERRIVEEWYDHRHSVVNRDHALLSAVHAVSERLYGRAGAVEAEWLPLGAWEILGLDHESHSVDGEAGERSNGACAVDLGSELRRLRRRKEPDEIELIKQCVQAAEAGHARAREVVRPGVSEFEMYREVQAAAQQAAGRPALVYGDFRATNSQSPKVGGLPTDYRLQHADLFLLDLSVVLDGYRCDVTNTLCVGEPTGGQQMQFRLCEVAMRAGEQALRAGTAASDVYAAVSTPLEEAGYGSLAHHAGHGLGLGHPEPPIFVPSSDDTLAEGDVVTLEPGLYVEGIGGMRIEHNYLVRADGFELLSHHSISLR